MQTFEEFMAHQGLSPTDPAVGSLFDWREEYEDACERARQASPVGTRALRKSPADLLYAVAIEDDAGLWLTLWVRRSSKPGYFVMIPRRDGEWNPHASWHVDGGFHHKTYDHRIVRQERQRPDASFKGSENMIMTPVTADARLVGAVCDRSQFDGLLVVAVSGLGAGQHHHVSVDLAQAGHCEVSQPGNRLVDQRVFKGSVPWVVVTLWESVYGLAVRDTGTSGTRTAFPEK